MKISLNNLFDALQRGTLALFIGADLPKRVTGLPSRANLAQGLAERYAINETLTLAEVAQRVSRVGNRFDFTAYIKKELDTTKLSPMPFHNNLTSLITNFNIETLITTAYDDMLVRCFRNASTSLQTVIQDSDLPFLKPGLPILICLYGQTNRPTSLVVTEQDHNLLLRDRGKEGLLAEVRRAFQRYTILFIGYNLTDPDFQFVFDQVAENRFSQTAYAIWSEISSADVQAWQDRGIVILEADPFNLLGDNDPLSNGIAEPLPIDSQEPKQPIEPRIENSLVKADKSIYISYAWDGESESIVEKLDKAFQKQGVTITIDKRDLGYRGRIKGFMESIGRGQAIILIISENYLKSENCLYELLQVAKHKDFPDRVFPIILEDARIYKPIDRLRYVKYWENQIVELDDALKEVSAANMHGFREDIDLYTEIRANLPRLSNILKDMNNLTPELHKDSGFREIINAVMNKLKE